MQGRADTAESGSLRWFGRGGARALRDLAAMPVGDVRAEIAVTLVLIPQLLAVALWNGFPIIFYDTGAYLLEGLGRVFLAERSPVYSLFLDYGGARASLWTIAILQAVATAFTIAETARALTPRLPWAALWAMVALLVVATGLPWYVGQIEPDCFAGIVVLALYLLAFHAESMGCWRNILLAALCAFAMAVHPSHLLLGGGLIAAFGLYRAFAHFRARFRPASLARRGAQPALARPAACCLFGLALIVAANHTLTGEFFVSRSGPAFVFARLLQDRIVMRLLDDTCPKSHYRLCAYKDVLPRTADQWLWGRASPFLKLGRFTGTSAESSRIIRDTLIRYPGLQLESALADALRQFAMFKTGDQIEPQEWILSKPLGQFIPRQIPAYLAARQQQGEIDFGALNRIHVGFGWLSLLALVAALGLALRAGRRREAQLCAVVLLALIGNAAICGALSNPHDRYQSRLVWLAPFALMLIAGDRAICALRGVGESGS